MNRYFVTDIQWDAPKEVIPSLPVMMEIPAEVINDYLEEDDDEIVSDWISDETGWCHKGFEIKEPSDFSAENGCALICEAARFGILSMPKADTVMLQIGYEDGTCRWEERNLFEAAEDLVMDVNAVELLMKEINNEKKRRENLGNTEFSAGVLTVITNYVKDSGLSVEKVHLSEEYDTPVKLDKFALPGAVVTVLHETELNGAVYRYGNHGDYWEEVGSLKGFA